MPADAEKRKAETSDGKTSKKYKHFTKRPGEVLPFGSRGFLVSCASGREREAQSEALQILQTVPVACRLEAPADLCTTNIELDYSAVQHYEKALSGTGEEKLAESGGNISDQLHKELSNLQDRSKAIFQYVKTGISGLFFVTMAKDAEGVGPSELLHHIAQDVAKTKQCMTKFCMRFSPVEIVCQAALNEIKAAATILVQPYFPSEDDAPSKTFAVQYDHRASAKFDREAIINAAVACIKQPPHKANLSNADLTIIVQILKGCCTIGLASDYRRYAKFNFRELCNSESNVNNKKEAAP